jgi:uncharacterized protein YjiK
MVVQNSEAGLILLVSCLLFAACQQRKKFIYTPQGYNITQPIKTEMGTKLREISGISWVDSNTMLANNDESGKIFTINLNDLKDATYPSNVFGPKADYEDIVKVDSMVYVLISDGQIVAVPGYGRDEGDLTGTVVATLAGKANEFESMYYDKDVHSLVMLCKSCHKEKDQERTAFRFDLVTKTLIDTPYFKIDINAIRLKLNDNRAEFRPSAAAINPIQNKLYIVSSIGKLLVITDKKGKVEHAMPISPTLFPQPEGITFAANGDMYISNEAAEEESATLLKFIYKK